MKIRFAFLYLIYNYITKHIGAKMPDMKYTIDLTRCNAAVIGLSGAYDPIRIAELYKSVVLSKVNHIFWKFDMLCIPEEATDADVVALARLVVSHERDRLPGVSGWIINEDDNLAMKYGKMFKFLIINKTHRKFELYTDLKDALADVKVFNAEHQARLKLKPYN